MPPVMRASFRCCCGWCRDWNAFPGVPIKLRGDAGFALPLLYQFCEFFGLQYAFGIAANAVFQRQAEPLQKRLARRYRRTEVPQRRFSSFQHRAGSWSRQRRICYKAEHTVTGTNLRCLITNCAGRASEVFAFYNDRGECENRIKEFKNGFRADRLIAFWRTPSVCCCTAAPTIWSICSVYCSFRSRGARRKSKLCAHACLKSALACARPPAASAFTSPQAARGNLYSASSPCPLTPANRFLSSPNSSLRP